MMKIIRPIFTMIILLNICQSQIRFLGEVEPEYTKTGLQFVAMTISRFGDIYLLEETQSEIYRIDEQGKILGVNGGFGWEEGNFDTPLDICIGSGLNILVADYNNHRIARFDRRLNFLAVHSIDSETEMFYPRSVTVSNIGEIFVLDEENSEVIRLHLQEGAETRFGGVDYGDFALDSPVLIRMEDNEKIKVLEKDGDIIEFDRFGTPITRLNSPGKIEATCCLPVNNGLFVLCSGCPYLYYRNEENQAWSQVEVIGYTGDMDFIALEYYNESLMLLKKNGVILICNIELLENPD